MIQLKSFFILFVKYFFNFLQQTKLYNQNVLCRVQNTTGVPNRSVGGNLIWNLSGGDLFLFYLRVCSYNKNIKILNPLLKFMFSKKATKINEIFTVDLTLCSKCQIYGEDLVNFCGLLTNFKKPLDCSRLLCELFDQRIWKIARLGKRGRATYQADC